LLETHQYLSTLPPDASPSLANILSINAIDLETQDHILTYQLPVAISRYNVGLAVIDSIAANYRAEHESNSMPGLSARSGELARLGQMLRNLAAKEKIAVVVANQVSDRFDSVEGQSRFPSGYLTTTRRERESGARSPLPKNRTQGGDETAPSSSPAFPSSPYVEDETFDGAYVIGHPVRNETLSLAHQQRFFTGWGDTPGLESTESQKTPALGFVWSTQIACRIALKKEDESRPMLDPTVTPSSQIPARSHGAPIPNNSTTASQETNVADIKSASADQGDESGLPVTTSQTSTLSQVADRMTKRRMKLVFAPWTAGMADNTRDEIEFGIWKGGIRSIQKE
jgi:DNA repair protein RAD57